MANQTESWICSDEDSAGNWGYLLVFSNLAMVPAVIISYRRGLYYDATVLFLGGFTSAVYHGIWSNLFLTSSPFGPSLNALDHSWGYWMTCFPLAYIGRVPNKGRRILEIALLWCILTVSMVGFESRIWIPGLGKDLTIAILVIVVALVVVLTYRIIKDGCNFQCLVGQIVWKYTPLVLLTVGTGVGAKVLGDKWGCYVGLHSLWHFGIMMSLWSMYLLRDPVRTSYVATNEIELEDVFLDGGQVEESSQGNLEEKKMK